MPDGWTGYDLAVDAGTGLTRVSVKTRSETLGWKSSSWFTFDDRRDCDWLVFIFRPLDPRGPRADSRRPAPSCSERCL